MTVMRQEKTDQIEESFMLQGIVGILLAVLAVFGVADKINLSSVYGAAFQSVGNWVGLAAFVVLLAILFYFTRNKKTIEVDAK